MYKIVIIVLSFLISIKCRPQNNASDELFQQCDDSEGCHPTDYREKERIMHPLSEPLERTKRSLDESDEISSYSQEKTSAFWHTRAQMTLRSQLVKERNYNIAKNVIYFLGDGMSIPTITAARIYMGQKQKSKGEEFRLSFEDFPYIGLSKTYCVNKQVADSACSATAYLCGVKGNFYTIGVNANVEYNDCAASRRQSNQVHSIAAWAQRAGKGTGIVTTTTVTHASPAGTYAHSSNRNFECDADVKRFNYDPKECQDIASQLIYNKPGNKFKVIFGGGRMKFMPKSEQDPDGNFGERDDNVNLIEYWKKEKRTGTYIYDKKGLEELNYNKTEYVLGLFSPGHMSFNLDADRSKEPSLRELTEAAIKLLQKESKGYFLFVEGGRIDHGHHETRAHKAIDETVEFSEAIKAAVQMTNRQDTLIVVTSDHAHTMSIAGYPDRGNDILKLNTLKSDVDNLPYTTLSYANGPGYNKTEIRNGSRVDLSTLMFHKDYLYPGTFPYKAETHGGDDVGVFALGPMSHLFAGAYEQNVIPHLVGYAACIGDGLTACNRYN